MIHSIIFNTSCTIPNWKTLSLKLFKLNRKKQNPYTEEAQNTTCWLNFSCCLLFDAIESSGVSEDSDYKRSSLEWMRITSSKLSLDSTCNNKTLNSKETWQWYFTPFEVLKLAQLLFFNRACYFYFSIVKYSEALESILRIFSAWE